MGCRAKRDQVFLGVGPRIAAELLVVHLKIRHSATGLTPPAVAYDFVTPAKDFVSNMGETGPDLIISKTFRLSKPTVLDWLDHFNRSLAVDAVVNIA